MKRPRLSSSDSDEKEVPLLRKDTIWRAHEDLCDDANESEHHKPQSRDRLSPMSTPKDNDVTKENDVVTNIDSPPHDDSFDAKGSTDLLCRLFPHMARSVLQIIVQSCRGDVTRAIEQVLSNHQKDSLATKQNVASPLLHSAYLTAATQAPCGINGLKSAFSPAALSNLTPPNLALRYPYPPTTRGGVPFGLAYPPHLFPGFAGFGYNYNTVAAAMAGNAQKPAIAYEPYPRPYSTTATEK